MKNRYKAIVFCLITVASCQKINTEFSSISQQDVIAIEGMEKSYLDAVLYNDSIFYCLDSSLSCENEFIDYCDSLFHHYEDEYNLHHNSYSHLNAGDDHHHEYMNQNHHGNGTMGAQNQGHSIQSVNQMDSLLSYHLIIH